MQPDMIASAVHALQLLLEPARLLILFVGVLIGLAIGVLPGLNGIVGMAMLIPFTYNLDEYTAFALLLGMAAVITSSDFITAVLFGVPGHVGAAATVIDGHEMAKKGEAGRAFGAGFAASLAGGIVGAIVLAVSIPILRPIMLSIGSPELLAFTLFGMSMVATLSGRAPLKGLTAAGLGLMIAMIGSRAQSGTLRWTFGWLYLWDGMPLIPATLGIFALPELAELAVSRKRIAGDNAPNINMSSQWEGVRDVARHWWLVLRCGVLGTGLGAIPGIGSAVIDWIAYGYAQRTEKNPETFGTGDVRGVIAPESSNNSKEGGHCLWRSRRRLDGDPARRFPDARAHAGPGHADQTSRFNLSDRLEPDARPCHRRHHLSRLQPLARAGVAHSPGNSSPRLWFSSPPSRASTIGAISIHCCSSASSAGS
jgi:TctA family transporter